MVPHFILPIELIAGGRNGWILTECSFWYHPSYLIGALLFFSGIISLMSRRALWVVAVSTAALLAHGVILKPLSYYLQSSDNIIVLSQTISLRAHAHLRLFLLAVGFLLLAALIGDVLSWRRHKVDRYISLLGLSACNIRRKSFRTVSLVMALAVVIGAFFANLLLTRTIGNTLALGAGRLGADLVVVPASHEKAAQEILQKGTPHVFNMSRTVYDNLREWPEVEKASPQIFFRPFSSLVCCTTEKVLVVGYDPQTDFTIKPWVSYHLRKQQRDDEIVVGAQVKLYPGQSIALLGERVKVAASLDHTGIGYYDNSAFIPLKGAQKLINFLKENEKEGKLRKRRGAQDLSLAHLFDAASLEEDQMRNVVATGVSAIFVKAADGVDIQALAKKISRKIPEAAVVNVRAATASIKKQLTSMLDSFALPIFILVVMGTIILMVVFSMSANERRREIGLLRAMGARKIHIFQLFFMEFMGITLLGGLFGILGGGGLLILFKNKIMASLDLLYIWPDLPTVFQVFVLTFLVALLVGLAAGLYPSIKAAKMEPYQAVRGS